MWSGGGAVEESMTVTGREGPLNVIRERAAPTVSGVWVDVVMTSEAEAGRRAVVRST